MNMEHTWGTSTNTLCVVSALQETVDTTDRELETSLRRARSTLDIAASLARGRFATTIVACMSEPIDR